MSLCGDAVWKGDGMSTAELSSSSEVLKVNWHHTGLQCDWMVPMMHGVIGSKVNVCITRNVVDSGGSSERSDYVKIFTTTLISFILQGEFTFKGCIECGHEATE